MSQADERPVSPRRSSSHARARRIEHPPSRDDDNSSNDRASPGSWDLDRGRSRTRRQSNPFSEDNLRRRGYHSLHSSFGNVFHVEKRWKMIRDLGSGAYGVVISAADEISGETVAIKQVNHIFEKVSLAKRALREVTLLRHFNDHENITGLIDIDAISSDFNEIYLFMQPMEADLHQIIKSGQALTNEHVQYFIYQVLRGMKFIHSASVVHRDLKPGNLLVNADCELKICDFGLSRGFDAAPEDNATHMTEYVATRWYRAPEIMLAFRRYGTAIDVWSIGCILAELLLGRPLFKGKDYVDQLNKILDILGTPDEFILQRIGSSKAQAYVRSLPIRKTVPFQNLMPNADPQALDLLGKMLAFDPMQRITVADALEHPWLNTYHDITDEPVCSTPFDKWKDIERLETLDEFRRALWNEIEEYRSEVRGHMAPPLVRYPSSSTSHKGREDGNHAEHIVMISPAVANGDHQRTEAKTDAEGEKSSAPFPITEERVCGLPYPRIGQKESLRHHSPASVASSEMMANDPVVGYARRNSILGPYSHQRQQSASISPMIASRKPLPSYQEEITTSALPEESSKAAPPSEFAPVPFPSQQQQQSYIIPARSRTASTAGEFVPRKLLRTLSTVSIHEGVENLIGGIATMGPIGELLKGGKDTGADAPASEMPREFDIEETSEGDSSDRGGKSRESSGKNEKRFIL